MPLMSSSILTGLTFVVEKGRPLPPEEDLSGIIAAKPDILIVGTGNMGVMLVPEDTIIFLEGKGIEVHVEKTGKAIEIFNSQPRIRRS